MWVLDSGGVNRQNKRLRAHRASDVPPMEKEQFARRWHVWGGLSVNGLSNHVFLSHSVDGNLYRALLMDNMDNFKQLFPQWNTMIFEDDWARPHTAEESVKFKEQHFPIFSEHVFVRRSMNGLPLQRWMTYGQLNEYGVIWLTSSLMISPCLSPMMSGKKEFSLLRIMSPWNYACDLSMRLRFRPDFTRLQTIMAQKFIRLGHAKLHSIAYRCRCSICNPQDYGDSFTEDSELLLMEIETQEYDSE